MSSPRLFFSAFLLNVCQLYLFVTRHKNKRRTNDRVKWQKKKKRKERKKNWGKKKWKNKFHIQFAFFTPKLEDREGVKWREGVIKNKNKWYNELASLWMATPKKKSINSKWKNMIKINKN